MTIKELVEKLQAIANEQGTDEIEVLYAYDSKDSDIANVEIIRSSRLIKVLIS